MPRTGRSNGSVRRKVEAAASGVRRFPGQATHIHMRRHRLPPARRRVQIGIQNAAPVGELHLAYSGIPNVEPWLAKKADKPTRVRADQTLGRAVISCLRPGIAGTWALHATPGRSARGERQRADS